MKSLVLKILVCVCLCHTIAPGHGHYSDELGAMCHQLGVTVGKAPSFSGYNPAPSTHGGVQVPRTYRPLFVGTGMWNSRMSSSDAVAAMLGDPTRVLTTPLLLGFKAKLMCRGVDYLKKIMPDTDEGHWKGEARPYFLNHVWNTVVRATPAMIQEVAGEAAPLVPAFNCADPHVAKDPESQQVQDAVIMCTAVALVNRHWHNKVTNSSFEHFYFDWDGELLRGPATAEDPFDSIYATMYPSIAHNNYGPNIVHLAPTACPESGNRELDLNYWRLRVQNNDMPRCDDDYGETIVPGYRHASQVVGYEHRREELVGFYKWLLTSGNKTVPASVFSDGNQGPLPCADQRPPEASLNRSVARTSMVVVAARPQADAMITVGVNQRYVQARKRFQCFEYSDSGEPYFVWAPRFPAVTSSQVPVEGVLYACEDTLRCATGNCEMSVSTAAFRLAKELRGDHSTKLFHWPEASVCADKDRLGALHDELCKLFDTNSQAARFMPEADTPVRPTPLCGWLSIGNAGENSVQTPTEACRCD